MPDATITILLSILGSAIGAEQALTKTSKGLDDLGRKLSILGREMYVLGTTLSIMVTAPLVGLAAVAVKAAATFDQEMRRVSGISDYVRQNFAKASDQVLDLSIKYGMASDKMAAALYQVYSAGIKGQQAFDLLDVAARASVAGLTEPETAIRGIIAVLTAYQLPISDAAKVSDILFRTVDKGILTFDELVKSLSEVVGSASIAQVPLDQLGAAFVLMTRSGFSASEAGTALNRYIRDFLKPAPAAAAAAQQLNFDLSAQALIDKGLIGVTTELAGKLGLYEIVSDNASAAAKKQSKEITLQTQAQKQNIQQQILNLRQQKEAAGSDKKRAASIQDQIDKLNQQSQQISLNASKQKTALALTALEGDHFNKVLVDMSKKSGLTIEQLTSLFPDVRALRAAFVLTADGGKDLTGVMDEMKDAAGATQRVFDEQAKSMIFRWNQMKETAKATAIVVFTRWGPAIGNFIDRLKALILAFKNLTPETQDWILKVLAAIAALGPFLIILSTVMRGMGLAIALFTGFRDIAAGLGGVLLGLAKGGFLTFALRMGLIGLAIIALKKIWDENWLGIQTITRQAVGKITDWLMGMVPPELRDAIKSRLAGIGPAIDQALSGRLGPLQKLIDDLRIEWGKFTKPILSLWNDVQTEWSKTIDLVYTIVVEGVLTPILTKLGEIIGKLLTMGGMWAQSFPAAVLSTALDLLTKINAQLEPIAKMIVPEEARPRERYAKQMKQYPELALTGPAPTEDILPERTPLYKALSEFQSKIDGFLDWMAGVQKTIEERGGIAQMLGDLIFGRTMGAGGEKQFSAAGIVLGIAGSIGTLLVVLGPLSDVIIDVAVAIGALKANIGVWWQFLSITAAWSGFSSVWTFLGTVSWEVISAGIASVGGAIAGFVSAAVPFLLIGLAIAFVIATIISYQDDIRTFADGFWKAFAAPALKDLADQWAKSTGEIATAMGELMTAAGELNTALGPLGEFLGNIAGALAGFIAGWLQMGVLGVVFLLISGFITMVTLAVKGVTQAMSLATGPITGVIRVFRDLAIVLKTVVDLIKDPSWDNLGKVLSSMADLSTRIAGLVPNMGAAQAGSAIGQALFGNKATAGPTGASASGTAPGAPATGAGTRAGGEYVSEFDKAMADLKNAAGKQNKAALDTLMAQLPNYTLGGESIGISTVTGANTTLANLPISFMTSMQNSLSMIQVYYMYFYMQGQQIAYYFQRGFDDRKFLFYVSIFNMINTLGSMFNAANANMYMYGANLIGNLIAGIQSKLDALTSVFGIISSFLPHSWPKAGPLSEPVHWEALFAGLGNVNVAGPMTNIASMIRQLAPSAPSAGPIGVRVYIGDQEIKQVVTDWSYEGVASLFSEVK